MKKIIIFIIFCIIVATNSNAYVSQEVDEFDGTITNNSFQQILYSYSYNKIAITAVMNNSNNIMLLAIVYFGNSYLAITPVSIEAKIDNKDIIKIPYYSQDSEYLSYYPIYQTKNIGMYDISNDIKNIILNAKEITLRLSVDAGSVVYDVPIETLREWKYILSSPLIAGYQSLYEKIIWAQRETDTEYCIDICDENWNILPGLQAVQCGTLKSWSPKKYINNLGIKDTDLGGFKFKWRVWSKSGYGGVGYEGEVVCP